MPPIGDQVAATRKDIQELIKSYEGKLDTLHELQSACDGIGDLVVYDRNEDGSVKVDPEGKPVFIHKVPKHILYNKRNEDIAENDRKAALVEIRKTFEGLSA